MCNSDASYSHVTVGSKRNISRHHRAKSRDSGEHHCVLKILACSSQRLCLLCVLLANFAALTNAEDFSTVIPSPTTASIGINETLTETNAGNQPTTTSDQNQSPTIPDQNQQLTTTANQHQTTTTTTPDQNQQSTTTANQHQTTTPTTDIETTTIESLPGHVTCNENGCYLKISSSKQALEKMAAVSEQLFNNYATKNGSKSFIDEKGLEDLMKDIGHMKDDHADHDHEHHGDSHEGHDHDHHEDEDEGHGSEEDHDHGSHEGHDHDHKGFSAEEWEAFFNLDYYDYEEDLPCYSTVKELVDAYFFPANSDTVQLTLGDFMTLMPQILLDIPRPECVAGEEYDSDKEEESTTKKTNIEHSTANIWLISFGSVLVISLVSLLGVLIVPLLKRSVLLNLVISFLVALAVGTLIGDALLHLLPHASGLHDHSSHEGHDHGDGEEEEDHFASMWKGLVACAGIYVFYLLETIMGFVRKKRDLNKKRSGKHSCQEDSPTSSSPSKETFKVNQGSGDAAPSMMPLVTVGHSCEHKDRDDQPREHRMEIERYEEPIDTGHHHHSHEVPDGIASLAWMVIVGDGLHNITDGLAIGAAFSSSIGAGLSTVLAIFFHEIPQELGDFAILLNAGMSVKQALLWNFISACMCFIGLLVGLLVGEYTQGIILWILAFTAGGFLYIALVDMLPAMIKQLDHKDYMKRFIIQNIGVLSGLAIMTVIALKEDAFKDYF